MKKFFTTDISTKILSLVIAVFLWVYLVVLLNPQIETTITNIPITFKDQANLARNGFVITNDTVDTVTLKLRGSRNMLSNVNKNNISAYVDLSGCSGQNTYTLPVHITLPHDELSIVDKSPYNISVEVDKVSTYKFGLEIVPEGELKKDHVIDALEGNISEVLVKGPSSLVGSIKKAVVTVDVSGTDADFTKEADVVLYNNQGERIESHLVSVDNPKVTIIGTVLFQKSVPVTYENINLPEGYEISQVLPANITLKGKKDVLSEISELPLKNYSFNTDELQAEIEIMYPENIESNVETVQVTIKEIITEEQPETDEEDNQ
ncbi:MAG: hypothetical protein J6V58_00220 [Clostridia bacterium]|nr:hypothetical protein [Clostridia bacterium]